jgi:hypothetical protein
VLWETTGFNKLVADINDRIAYERTGVERIAENPPSCVTENVSGLLAFSQ